MAFRANDADGYKGWLALGIEQLRRDVAAEVEPERTGQGDNLSRFDAVHGGGRRVTSGQDQGEDIHELQAR